MKFIVNGIDLVSFLSESGYKVTREDGDSSDAGRTMDFTMHRARIATKYGIDFTLKPLKREDAYRVLPSLMPVFVQVTYTNPYIGADVTTTMYNAKGTATIDQSYDGVDLWNVDTIHLAER